MSEIKLGQRSVISEETTFSMFDLGILSAVTNVSHSALSGDSHITTSLSCTSSNSCPGIYENALNNLDTSTHTWHPTTPVDATSVDAPYSSYSTVPAQLSDANQGQSLATCASTHTCPGVYENALNDLDQSPHVWNAPVIVDPNQFDSPYSSYAVQGTSQLSYDGTCNPMPGWNPSWNPSSDIGCRVNPMYNQPGLGYGASFGSGAPTAVVEHASADVSIAAAGASTSTVAGSSQLYDTYHPGICDPMPGWKVTWNPPDCSTQTTPDVRGLMPPAAWSQTEALAPPTLAVTSTVTGESAAPEAKASRPSPGHLLLCGHAALLGAASATAGLVRDLLEAKPSEGALDKWGRDFRNTTAEAAAAVTPVGAYVLREHVLGKHQEVALEVAQA